MLWIAAGLTNALFATLLGGLIALLFRRRLSPAWRHLLWTLVLVKLLTPPLFVVPLRVSIVAGRWTFAIGSGESIPLPAVVQIVFVAIGGIWLIGSLVHLTQRIWCYRWIWQHIDLQESPESQAANRAVADLAKQLKISWIPPVRLSRTATPNLFGLPGMVAILFPEHLWTELDPETRRSLLAHELGHYVRRDHWVRVLEATCQILFWWLPAVWWATQEIEAAEEDCCDAWVVHTASVNRRNYGHGIITTLALASRARLTPCESLRNWSSWILPSRTAASVEDRLIKIMRGGPEPRLSAGLRFSSCVFSAACLPLFFTLQIDAPASATLASHQPPNSPVDISPAEEPLDWSNWYSLNCDQPWATIQSPHGKYKVQVHTNRQLEFQNIRTGETHLLSQGNVTCMAFLPSGDQFLTGDASGAVRLWLSPSSSVPRLIGRHADEVGTLSLSPDGTRVISGSRDGQVRVWDLRTGKMMGTWESPGQPITVVRYSKDGRQVVVAAGHGDDPLGTNLAILDADRLHTRHSMTILELTIAAAEFGEENNLFFADWTGRVSIWNLMSSRLASYRNISREELTSAAFAPHTSLIAAADQPAKVDWWLD